MSQHKPEATKTHTADGAVLRLVFWETTTGCNLRCIHCRASAVELSSSDDLSTEEGLAFVDSLADFARPVLVLSGGEPLFRDDIFEIAARAHQRELPVALATNGTLVDESIAAEIKRVGIRRVSISVDGAEAETHDAFRGISGAFEQALAGMRRIQDAGVPVQINSTIAKHNVHQIDDLFALAMEKDAVALHVFMLVPVGCGVEIADDQMIEAEEYERALTRLYELSRDGRIEVKATCAPHYYRIARQMEAQDRKRHSQDPDGVARVAGQPVHPSAPSGHDGHPHGAMASRGARPGMPGCLAGTGVCFVSHKGEVFPCGYLPVKCGDIREQDIGEIWTESQVFQKLRDVTNITGKCGACEYVRICLGCRARAFADTGDYLAEEPYCTYVPRKMRA
jgi:radical SAM protein with 4Fe4S-binding SPASM domain